MSALLLENFPGLSDLDFMAKIRDGAEKVGGYTYTGLNNKSTELAGGRISCINSLNASPLDIKNENKNIQSFVKIIQDINDWNLLFVNNFNKLEYKIFNNLGQLIENGKINNSTKNIQINHTRLAKGIYYLQLNIDNNKFNTIKLVN